MDSIKEYYASLGKAAPDSKVLEQMEMQADKLNMTGMTTLFVIVSVTLVLLFITLYFVKENERKHKKQLELVRLYVKYIKGLRFSVSAATSLLLLLRVRII